MTVTVYSKNNCPQCLFTKRELSKRGLEFTEINLEENAETLENLKAEGFMSAPVVKVSMNGQEESWAGFHPQRIKALASSMA